MPQSNDYSFKLLPERVADSDKFTAQAHTKAAVALYEMISEDDHGVTIGIEGTLGSGKSTVINLLEKEIQNKREDKSESNLVLFTFDAWAHSGDSLRRAFLVELVSSLIEMYDGECAYEKLSAIKDRLNSRKKVLNSTTSKSSTNFGTFLTFAALMVPVGAGILSGVDYSMLVTPWSPADKTISWPLVTGILIAIGPLLSLILFWRFFGKIDLPDGETNNAALAKWSLIREIDTERTDESLAFNLEPTSIEFESCFKNILNIAHEGGKISKVVIVLDNLDRIEQADLKNVWATLQTFFQKRSAPTSKDEKQSIQDKVQFLVPFDREKFEDLWADKNSRLLVHKDASNLDQSNDSPGTIEALSFLEKSLQASVDVPPVLPSSWVEYLKHCLDEALVNWPDEEKTNAVECVKSLQSENPTPPTPRQIRAIINRAAPIKKRWGTEMSTKAVFSYAFHRHFESESAFRQRLLGANADSFRTSSTFDKELLKEMSGILFGVTAEDGLELLLQEPIIRSLQSNNAGELIELAHQFKSGFEVAMKNCKARWMISESSSPEEQMNPSTALCALLGSYELPQKSEYVEHFCEALKNQFLAWSVTEHQFASLFDLLLEHSEKKDSHLSWLSKGSEKLASDLFTHISNEPVARAQTKQLNSILSYLKSQTQRCSQRSFTPSNLSIDDWGNWLRLCDQLKFDDASDILKFVSLSSETTASHIEALGPDFEELNGPSIFALRRSVELFPNDQKNWCNLAKHTEKWFSRNEGIAGPADLYELVLTLLLTLEAHDTADLRSVIAQDAFWNALQDKEISSLSYLALIYMAGNESHEFPDNTDACSFWNEAQKDKVRERSLKLAEMQACTPDIWRLAQIGAAHAMQLILESGSGKLFSDRFGAIYIGELSEGIFDEPQTKSVAEKLITSGSLEQILPLIKKSPTTYNKAIFIFHKYGDQKAQEELQEILKLMSAENWTELIQSDDELMQIIPDSSVGFTEAYQDLLQKLTSEGDSEGNSPLGLFAKVKNKLLSFKTKFSANILRSYFEANEDLLTEEDFKILIPDLIHALGSVEETDYQNRLCTWLDGDEFSRIEATFSTKVSDIKMFASTNLEHFRAKLADRMRTVSDAEEKSDEIKRLQKLEAKLNEVTEAGDRRDTT